jgi:hypothetical protein
MMLLVRHQERKAEKKAVKEEKRYLYALELIKRVCKVFTRFDLQQ